MPTTPDPRIDAYLAAAAPFARPILTRLRALVHRGCPAATETIKWGMPFFEHHGLLCHLAAFKAHCAFGFNHQKMDALIAADGHPADTAMGNLGRITSLADLPSDAALLRYLKAAAKLNESGTPRRPPTRAKPALPVPPDLAAALKKNPPAAATFEKFSSGHRREYLEWLLEAKRPETRAKRLATTLEWLAAGKARNWKYENC